MQVCECQIQTVTPHLIDKLSRISLQVKSPMTKRTTWVWLLQFLDVTAKHILRRWQCAFLVLKIILFQVCLDTDSNKTYTSLLQIYSQDSGFFLCYIGTQLSKFYCIIRFLNLISFKSSLYLLQAWERGGNTFHGSLHLRPHIPATLEHFLQNASLPHRSPDFHMLHISFLPSLKTKSHIEEAQFLYRILFVTKQQRHISCTQ